MARRSLYSIIILVAVHVPLEAQHTWTLRAYGGIGIGVASLPSLADYANVVGGASGERVNDFQSLFDLNGGLEISIADGWSLGLDYVSSGRTIETNPSQPGSGWTFEPALHMPSVVIRRYVVLETMAYGFGGGVGYHAGEVQAIPPGLISGSRYSGSGMGLLAEAIAFTYFDDSFAGMIAVDVRWSGIRQLRDGNGVLLRTGNGIEATLNTFMISLRFGISYQM